MPFQRGEDRLIRGGKVDPSQCFEFEPTTFAALDRLTLAGDPLAQDRVELDRAIGIDVPYDRDCFNCSRSNAALLEQLADRRGMERLVGVPFPARELPVIPEMGVRNSLRNKPPAVLPDERDGDDNCGFRHELRTPQGFGSGFGGRDGVQSIVLSDGFCAPPRTLPRVCRGVSCFL